MRKERLQLIVFAVWLLFGILGCASMAIFLWAAIKIVGG